MKKFLLSIFCAVGLFSIPSMQAQTFSTASDTVYFTYYGNAQVNLPDRISTPSTADSVKIKWSVTASNFPIDWYSGSEFGICDNYNCYSGNNLWNGTTGGSNLSHAYAGANGDFHMQLNLGSASTAGTYYMTIRLANSRDNNDAKNVTFMVSKFATGINSFNTQDENVVLYPNPAHGELNITYSPMSGVSTISVYNLIGRVVRVYKPTDNSGARLNLSDVPAGIYFVRLQDAQGAIISTRKFTHE